MGTNLCLAHAHILLVARGSRVRLWPHWESSCVMSMAFPFRKKGNEFSKLITRKGKWVWPHPLQLIISSRSTQGSSAWAGHRTQKCQDSDKCTKKTALSYQQGWATPKVLVLSLVSMLRPQLQWKIDVIGSSRLSNVSKALRWAVCTWRDWGYKRRKLLRIIRQVRGKPMYMSHGPWDKVVLGACHSPCLPEDSVPGDCFWKTPL